VQFAESCLLRKPALDEIAHKIFRFEGFTLDVMRRSLRHGDRDVDLRPKSFDVLRCLVEQAGQLVTKDELIESVWPNVVVTDESLTRCVSDVRLALGDSDQRIVKTIPRRGYLLAAPVSRAAPYEPFLPAADLAGLEPLDRPMIGKTSSAASGVWLRAAGQWRSLSALVSAVMLLAAIGTSIWFWNQSSGLPLPGRPSIAVMPFVNLSGDSQQDYFSDGIAEDLTTGLSKFADLFTIAHDSALKYKGRHIDVKQIGRELGVRYVLQGSTRRDPEKVRITAQLVEAASGVQLWAERYDGDLSGLFAVQDEITHKIVVTLVAHISKSELDRALQKPPATPAAHDYYLRGNALMQNMPPNKHGETIATARTLYEQAIAADPRYAPAIQRLAITYFRSWVDQSPDHPIGREFQQQAVLDHAESLAQQAVELDKTLAIAHATLGWILHWQNHSKEGTAEFERAFEFNPNFVDGRFGALLSLTGRAPEAIEYLNRIMRLDPFYSPLCTYYLGMAHFFVGRYDEALEIITSTSSRLADHHPSRVLMAAIFGHLGRNEQARAAATEVLRTNPAFSIAGWPAFLRISKQDYSDRLTDGLRKAGLPD
jgi:TolB-like protein/DNA-binding winged helix-turn-helix (wHTH) protein